MTGDALDKKQTQAMADALFRSVNYLLRMKERMREKGFEHDDTLLALTEKAYEGVQRLFLDPDEPARHPGPMQTVHKPSAEHGEVENQ